MQKKIPVVGIWGMGRLGKTTIAKAMFDKFSSQYDSCCFSKNVSEVFRKIGSSELHDKPLCELLKDDIISINPHKVVGLKHAIRRLCTKMFSIILDDVDNSKQLEHLAHEYKLLFQIQFFFFVLNEIILK